MGHGAKYQTGMDTAEIAKRIRADIKAAQKAGALSSRVKVSVRTRRFAGGSAVDLEVTACPFMVMNVERINFELHQPHGYTTDFRHSERARALQGQLRAIASEYLRDDSDVLSDYFNCNFYLSVDFASALEQEERADIIAALQASPARNPCAGRTLSLVV